MGSKGIAEVDGVVRYIEKIERDKVDDWLKSVKSDEAGLRVLGVYRNAVGVRDIDYKTAVGFTKEKKIADWLDEGPRVVGEHLDAISAASGISVSYRADFVRLSGVAETSSQCHEHRIGLETPRCAIHVDQLNVKSLTSFENHAWRLIQLGTAIGRNPRHPDFLGLDEVTAGPSTSRGVARVPKYMQHVTERQKERATIWKQSRLWKRENEREVKRT